MMTRSFLGTETHVPRDRVDYKQSVVTVVTVPCKYLKEQMSENETKRIYGFMITTTGEWRGGKVGNV